MRVLFGVLLGASVLLSLAFIVALGAPKRHADTAMAWFLASTGWAALALDAALFAALLGAHLPGWVYAIVLGVQDAVFGWRLWLTVRARRRQ